MRLFRTTVDAKLYYGCSELIKSCTKEAFSFEVNQKTYN
jgi:hypothetical protein